MTFSPPKPCPEELLYKGYYWETLREFYFASYENWSKAAEVRSIRQKYQDRLAANGVSVDLEKRFSH
jgi:hypothetical protein